MNARPKLAPEQQMTIEEFLAFTDTRPDGGALGADRGDRRLEPITG